MSDDNLHEEQCKLVDAGNIRKGGYIVFKGRPCLVFSYIIC